MKFGKSKAEVSVESTVSDEPPYGYIRIPGSGGFNYPRNIDLGPEFLTHLKRQEESRRKTGSEAYEAADSQSEAQPTSEAISVDPLEVTKSGITKAIDHS